MAYADRDTSGSRVVAIILCSVIVAAFGYAFVTGLASSIAKKVQEKMQTFDVAPPPPPPPPDKPPPPPPDQPNLPPPPTAPPVFNSPVPAPNNTFQPSPPAPPTLAPPSPPAPPAPVAPPAPPAIASPGGPKGNPGGWFTDDDFPPGAKRAGASGRVAVSLSIDAGGKVVGCRVTASSGNSDLDDTTCRLATRRGRFNVKKDVAGNALPYSWPISTRWVLREE